MRLAGRGGPGINGGPSGDLYLRIHVIPSDRFDRRGDDLYVDVPVDLSTALLGGEVIVPGMNRNLALKIPAGAQNNRVFRLSGQGMPHQKDPSKRGNLFARIQIAIPTSLAEDERELLHRFAELRRERGKA